MIRSGEQHIASLRDGREIYLDGELVDDVTTHPAYRGAVASIGRMLDFQSAPENRELMTFETETGKATLIDFMMPRGAASDLVRIVRCDEGEVTMCMELVLRFGYGGVHEEAVGA